MSQSRTLLFAAVLLGGCVVTPSSSENADPGPQPLGDAEEAYSRGPGDGPGLDPECPNGGNHTVHNPGFPAHQRGVCAMGGGFGLPDAIAACGGPVKYFSNACDDFPATPPYQPFNERAWTAYVGCCAGPSLDHGGPGPRPIGPGPGPIGPGPINPGPIGPGPGGPGFGGHHGGEGPGVVPVPVPTPVLVPVPVPGPDHGYHGTPPVTDPHGGHHPPT